MNNHVVKNKFTTTPLNEVANHWFLEDKLFE
jgi:hypothetical protein